jgi:hypothetical protein
MIVRPARERAIARAVDAGNRVVACGAHLAPHAAMRSSSTLCSLLLYPALVGCVGGAAPDEPALEDSALPLAKPATIHITSQFPPAVVVFRELHEGKRGRWQPATQLTPTTFEARVRGPYVVTVVCAERPIFVDFNETLTWQVGRTLDDSHELSFCDVLPTEHTVTGHMVQPGFVQIGDNNDRSTVPDWDFSIPVPSGSFDLIATSADAIAIRRGLAIDGDLAVTPAVDLAQEGTGLVGVAFSAPNATADETTQVSVGLLNPTTPFIPARIFLGPLATAKAAPDPALLASDTQSASVRAFVGTGFRAQRRPFRVGGDAVYTLPPPLTGVQWTVADGELSMHWATLPEFTVFSEFVGGSALFPLTPPSYLVDLSPQFIAATRIHDFTIDTDIPGFRPEWTVDFTNFYDRDLTVQNLPEPFVVITSEVTEFIDPTQLAPQARAALPRTTAPVRRSRDAVEP